MPRKKVNVQSKQGKTLLNASLKRSLASQEDSQEIVDAAKKKRKSLTTVQMEELSLTEGRQNHVDKMEELMEATDVQVNLTAKTILNRQMPRIFDCGESSKELEDWVKCTFAASAERQADAFKLKSKFEILLKKGQDLERRFEEHKGVPTEK